MYREGFVKILQKILRSLLLNEQDLLDGSVMHEFEAVKFLWYGCCHKSFLILCRKNPDCPVGCKNSLNISTLAFCPDTIFYFFRLVFWNSSDILYLRILYNSKCRFRRRSRRRIC